MVFKQNDKTITVDPGLTSEKSPFSAASIAFWAMQFLSITRGLVLSITLTLSSCTACTSLWPSSSRARRFLRQCQHKTFSQRVTVREQWQTQHSISSFFSLSTHFISHPPPITIHPKKKSLIRSMQFPLCSCFICKLIISFTYLIFLPLSGYLFSPHTSPIACDPAGPLLGLFGFQLFLANLHQVFQFAESV